MANKKGKLVVFIPDEIVGFTQELKKSGSKVESVTPSSFTNDDKVAVENVNPKLLKAFLDDKNTEPNLEFDSVLFEQRRVQKLKQKYYTAVSNLPDILVLAETAFSPTDLAEIKREFSSKGTFGPMYDVIIIQAPNLNPAQENKGKLLYFISGDDAKMFAEQLTKGSPNSSITICDDNIRGVMDKEFVPAVLNTQLNLIVVITTNFSTDGKDEEFYGRVGEVGGYLYQSIKLVAGSTTEKPELQKTTTAEKQKPAAETPQNTQVAPKVKRIFLKEWRDQNPAKAAILEGILPDLKDPKTQQGEDIG